MDQKSKQRDAGIYKVSDLQKDVVFPEYRELEKGETIFATDEYYSYGEVSKADTWKQLQDSSSVFQSLIGTAYHSDLKYPFVTIRRKAKYRKNLSPDNLVETPDYERLGNAYSVHGNSAESLELWNRAIEIALEVQRRSSETSNAFKGEQAYGAALVVSALETELSRMEKDRGETLPEYRELENGESVIPSRNPRASVSPVKMQQIQSIMTHIRGNLNSLCDSYLQLERELSQTNSEEKVSSQSEEEKEWEYAAKWGIYPNHIE